MSNAKKKEAPKVVAARFVSLPSKHLVISKLEDGTVVVQGVTTAHTARSTAQDLDRNALEVNSKNLCDAIGPLVFEPPKK